MCIFYKHLDLFCITFTGVLNLKVLMYPYEFHFYYVKKKCNTQPEFPHSYTDLKKETILKYMFSQNVVTSASTYISYNY